MRAPIVPRRQPQHPFPEDRLVSPRKWPKLVGFLAVAAGLAGGLAAGLGTGCVIQDPEYCDSNVKCSPLTDGTQMVCNTVRHTCVASTPNGCGSNDQCKDPARPRCDLLSMACTPCRTDDPMSCSSVSASARCTQLGSGETRCVECGKNTDCPAARPICDLGTNQCRTCQRHSDCEGDLICHAGAPCKDSLVCIKDGDLAEPGLGGRCAANDSVSSGQVLYMASPDPKDVNATLLCNNMDAMDGRTPERALCRMTEALKKAKSGNLRYIRLIGDWDFDVGQQQLISEGPYHFIGAPRAGGTQNRGLLARGRFLEILKGVSVTFDQVDLREQIVDGNLIFCDGRNGSATEPSSLRILGSNILGSSLPSSSLMMPATGAIVVADCNLLVDRSVIGVAKKSAPTDPNAGAHPIGIRYWADTRSYARTTTIQNSLIAGNIINGIRFDGPIDAAVKVRIQFNTIYGNGRRANIAGAVYCPLSTPTLPSGAQFLNNIIYGNGTDAAKSQFFDPTTSACTFHNTVVGMSETSTAPGLVKGEVDVGEDLRTVTGANSDKNVIDKAVPYMNPSGMTEAVPAYDLDGNRRPQPTGGAADVGATEVKK